jgi:hypothetical protein
MPDKIKGTADAARRGFRGSDQCDLMLKKKFIEVHEIAPAICGSTMVSQSPSTQYIRAMVPI